MPFSPKTLEEKPYNACIDCVNIGKSCDGPNFLAMEMTRLSEWCRLRKDYLHAKDPKWTNTYISEKADVSKVTVDRFLSGNVDDIKMSTAARIVRVLVNGSWGQYPCAIPSLSSEDSSNLSRECTQLRHELEETKSSNLRKLEHLQKQLSFYETQIQEKDKIIAERRHFMQIKDRYIFVLALCLGIALAVILGSLIVDKINPNIGFFWLDPYHG